MLPGMRQYSDQTNRWALLIGINSYPLLSASAQLRGCVNDVEVLSDTLQAHFGFAQEQVVILRDEQATRAGILGALDALLQVVQTGAVVVLAYSGHGSQKADPEGDEPDGMDETIVPYDSGREPYPNRDITDDEIHAWLLKMGALTPYITLLFDCCHSGTLSRDPFATAARWVAADLRSSREQPAQDRSPAKRATGASGWLPRSDRYVLLAGCHDSESSYEYVTTHNGEPVVHGALSYFLCQELVKAQAGATYRDIFERASRMVTGVLPHQHPQLEGARDRELFGIADLQPARYVFVRERDGDRITLSAGAAHAMTVGSQWAVYAQPPREEEPAASRIGLAEITRVRARSSDAVIQEEQCAGRITPGSYAVELAHSYGEMRLCVEIQAPARYGLQANLLRQAIGRSGFLRCSAPDELADVRVYLLEPRTQVSPGEPLPQMPIIAQAIWAAVNQEGRLIMPAQPTHSFDAIDRIQENLEKTARYQQALALTNPTTQLKYKVECTILYRLSDGTWIEPEPYDESGLIYFEEGSFIGLKVTNRHSGPLSITVLDFGLTGAISQLYPIEGASEPLGAGQTIEIGLRAGDEIQLYLPDTFALQYDPSNALITGGIETFKVLITTEPADFSMLVQEGTRGALELRNQPAASPLVQLLTRALCGAATRDRTTPPAALEDWATEERTFFLQRTQI